MKMTMHVDEVLLNRVMAATGAATKTAAIDLALREMDRRSELTRLADKGLELGAGELREVFDPQFDLEKVRNLETPVSYVRKTYSRR
jgi:Arc/MetJ family transcription regulator